MIEQGMSDPGVLPLDKDGFSGRNGGLHGCGSDVVQHGSGFVLQREVEVTREHILRDSPIRADEVHPAYDFFGVE